MLIDFPFLALELGRGLSTYKDFKNSEERIALGWSYYFENNYPLAMEEFREFDRPYTNYKHRIEYVKLLFQLNKPEEAEEVLAPLLEEFELLRGNERSLIKV